MIDSEITFVCSEEAFYSSIEPLLHLKLGDYISLDIETTGLDCFNDKIILIQLCIGNKVFIYDVRKLKPAHVIYILSLIEPKTIIGHNIKFDMKFILKNYGIMFKNVYDIMLAETIINAGIGAVSKITGRQRHGAFYSYEFLVGSYIGEVGINKEIRKLFEGNYNIQVTPEVIDYCAKDVIFLELVMLEQRKQIEKRKISNVINLEMQLLPAVVDMEYNGVLLNTEKWLELSKIAEKNAAELSEKILEYIITDLSKKLEERPNKFTNAIKVLDYYKVTYKKTKKDLSYLEKVTEPLQIIDIFKTNVNLNSPKQMLKILHKLGIESDTTASPELKMKFKDQPFVELLLKYREWQKKITSFGNNFIEKINPETGRVHSEFHQGGTATGRFASYNPDLQNILSDAEYRKCFISPDGWDTISADYSQIELAIAAELSQDDTMLNAFRNDISLHAITASSIHGGIPRDELTLEQYTKGKSMNFAMLYGSSPKGISYNFQVPIKEAYDYVDAFTATYPKLIAFRNGVHREILSRGYSTTMLGRKRWFIIPAAWQKSDWKYLYEIYREGFSQVIQGGSADITKLAMKSIWWENSFGELLKMVLTVHDEIVFWSRKDITKDATKFIQEYMVMAAKNFIKSIPVKIDIKIAPYWIKEEDDDDKTEQDTEGTVLSN